MMESSQEATAQDRESKYVAVLASDTKAPASTEKTRAMKRLDSLLKTGLEDKHTDIEDAESENDDIEDDDEESTTESEQQEELTPQQKLYKCLDRTLIMYCQMKDHRKEFPDDFSIDEFQCVTKTCERLLQQVFDRMTKTRTSNYLKIYYDLYKLNESRARREQLLDEFSDVLQVSDMEEFFQQSSAEFVMPIDAAWTQLNSLVTLRKLR